jgi:hypothetical protein
VCFDFVDVEGVCSLGYDPRPTPSLLRVGMKLSDPDLLKTAEPLIYIIIYPVRLSIHEDVTSQGVNPPLQLLLPLNLTIDCK